MKSLIASSLSANWPDDAAASAAVVPAKLPAPAAAVRAPRRLKLWELDEKYHCPVIGTCVSMEELVRFARRFGFSSPLRDEFALHVEAVNRTFDRSEFAEAVQRHLERKYATTLKRFDAARCDAEVRQAWGESLTRGEVPGPVWATLTHKHASDSTRHFVYADLHMLSHQVGAGKAADVRRLAFLENEHLAQRDALQMERRERERREAELMERITDRDARLMKLKNVECDASDLRARLAGMEQGSSIAALQSRVEALERSNEKLRAEASRAASLEAALAASQAANTRLTTERDQLAAESEALERLLLTSPAVAGEDAPCATSCPLPVEERDGPRCVLCVGGRTSLVTQYQSLAKRIGIRLVHHDGGQEEALSRLPDMIAGADAVICPTDAVSHSAYYQLKQQCRRNGKPCLLFKGAGVSSFALALTRLANGAASIAGAAPESAISATPDR